MNNNRGTRDTARCSAIASIVTEWEEIISLDSKACDRRRGDDRKRSTSRVCDLKARDRLQSEYLSRVAFTVVLAATKRKPPRVRPGRLSRQRPFDSAPRRHDQGEVHFPRGKRKCRREGYVAWIVGERTAVQRRKTETKVETRPTSHVARRLATNNRRA